MTSNRGNTETSVALLTSKNCNGENPFMRNEFFVNLALGAAPIRYKKTNRLSSNIPNRHFSNTFMYKK